MFTFEFRYTDEDDWSRSLRTDETMAAAAVRAGEWLLVCAENNALIQVRLVKVAT